jgi:tRNA U34 5-methylaminomethyl-2-thiouridine-forming methyltransferase MnmC
VIASEKTSDLFYKISSAAWDYPAVIISGFNLIKSVCSLQEAEFTPGHFHLVYFDAFSPAVQPEMWTENVFRKLYESMAPGAILMTYSCKGIVKRALRSSGFTIERLPGPPGKREIIRACKLT